MLKAVHFLLTYRCNLECDHCFVYSGPTAKGTFTLPQIRRVLDEIAEMKGVERVYFEGGEPFLYYPLMVEAMRLFRAAGLELGVVSNGYWANSEEDAQLWLRPLGEIGIVDLSISDDSFHREGEGDTHARVAMKAADELGIPVNSISIEEPSIAVEESPEKQKGAPVTGGSTMLRGRAVEKFVEGLPTRPWQEFDECPHEDLRNPERVHLDPYGNVHLCQGLSMGNMWKTGLSTLVERYDADSHPICGPLLEGGPAELSRLYNLKTTEEYVDHCHLCYSVRLTLRERFPEYLAPQQVYGLT